MGYEKYQYGEEAEGNQTQNNDDGTYHFVGVNDYAKKKEKEGITVALIISLIGAVVALVAFFLPLVVFNGTESNYQMSGLSFQKTSESYSSTVNLFKELNGLIIAGLIVIFLGILLFNKTKGISAFICGVMLFPFAYYESDAWIQSHEVNDYLLQQHGELGIGFFVLLIGGAIILLGGVMKLVSYVEKKRKKKSNEIDS